jgi:hypothetical protein
LGKEGNVTEQQVQPSSEQAPTETAGLAPVPVRPPDKKIVQHCRDNKDLFIAYLNALGSEKTSKLWGISISEVPRLKREWNMPVQSRHQSVPPRKKEPAPRSVVYTTPEGHAVKKLEDMTPHEKEMLRLDAIEAGVAACQIKASDHAFKEALERTLAKAREEREAAERVYYQLVTEVEALEIIIKRLEVKK